MSARHAASPRPAHKRETPASIRRWQAAGVSMLAALVMAGGGAWTLMPHYRTFDPARAVTRTQLVEASRSAERTSAGGSWTLGSDISDTGALTVRAASNKTVQALVNGRDKNALPDGFDPNHASGDTGNAYEFSQCTWWAYVRRHQLGLPVGSHMGNGADWAASARKLGYWVDNTPRVGDIICFGRGQYGSDATYGHVAIVEQVGPDGSITTSECGSVMQGKTYSRTLTADQTKQLQFIHY